MKSVTICGACKSRFKPGITRSGLPRGVGFQLENGKINLCAGCICKLGTMSPEQRDEFFKNLI